MCIRDRAVGHPGDEADEQPRQRVPEDREDNLAGVEDVYKRQTLRVVLGNFARNSLAGISN